MTSYEEASSTPVPVKEPFPTMPGLQQRIGDLPKERETTASKKVDDISKHESKHSLDPKLNPKHNAREKATDGTQDASGHPGDQKSLPGMPKK
jgi:hypothetical protein